MSQAVKSVHSELQELDEALVVLLAVVNAHEKLDPSVRLNNCPGFL
jgi:hypothetical protein